MVLTAFSKDLFRKPSHMHTMLHLDEITFFVACKEPGFNNGSLKVTIVRGVRTTATEMLPDRSFLGYCGTVFRQVSLSPQVACHLPSANESLPVPVTLARVFQLRQSPFVPPTHFTCASAHGRRAEHEAQVIR